MEDMEWIERHFRKELTADEAVRFNERIAKDPAFKRKFETELVVHKALQFSRERARVKAFALNPATVPAMQWLDNKAFVTVGGAALAVWIFSTYSSGLTSLSPDNIKWVGLAVAVAASLLLLAMRNKTMNLRLGMTGLLNGLLVFVTASGIDAINQGAEGIESKSTQEAYLVPYTGNKPWWPTQSLEDSLTLTRKQMQEMGNQIKTLIASRLNSGPNLNFGLAKFTPVVVPYSSPVLSGSTYQADIFLGTSPLRQTLEMRVDGKPILMESDPSGVVKGKVAFKVATDQFDNTGIARKEFVAEIKMGDSTYRKVVEYTIIRPN